MKKATETRSMLMLLLCTLMWSISGLLIRYCVWSPVVTAGGRSLIAGTVTFLYLRLSGHRFTVSRRALFCGCTLAGWFLCFVASSRLAGSANAIVLQQCSSIFVLLAQAAFFRQRLRLCDTLAVLLTTAGIALFFMDGLASGRFLGNLIGLGAGLMAACTYLIQARCDEDTALSGILFGHVFCAAVGLIFAFITPISSDLPSILAVLSLGIVQLGIPFILFGLYAHNCSPLAVSILAICEAIFNPLWVALVFGEVPSALALCGAALVLATVAVWTWLRSRKPAASSPVR